MIRVKIDHKDLIKEACLGMLTNENNGFIIENFLNKEKCAKLLNYFYSSELKVDNGNGQITLPGFFTSLFSEFKFNENKHNAYLKTNSNFFTDLEKNESLSSFYNKLLKTFRNIHNKKTTCWKSINQEVLVPFSFRELLAGQGNFKRHNENQTFDFHKNFFDKHKIELKEYEKYSFFVLLNKPTKGGELFIYGKDNLEISKRKIEMNLGDLVVFSSAEIWHNVSLVEGNLNRITLGGFWFMKKNSNRFFMFS